VGLFRSPPWESVVYWALDLEMGGLDARKDPILAVGMVPIRGGTVRLGEAYRTLVRPGADAHIDPDSVPAHQLLRAEVQAAPPMAEVVPEIARRLREAVLIVHHRQVDVPFLRREFRSAGLRWPSPRVVDTARLILRIGSMALPGVPADMLPLQLGRAREEYGLPPYQAHDALTDAIATAELFLVLRKVIGARTVRDLL
jgi:DNA polymerase III subunit epsilon